MSHGERAMPAGSARFRLLVAGVGGQGVLTTARCLGDAALYAGLNVVVGQLHGMSQRGGSVEASVLIGPGKTSFIGAGTADVLLAFEPLEALRALGKLAPHAMAIVSSGRVAPPTLALAGESYPELAAIWSEIRAAAGELVTLDAQALAAAAGDSRALGAVMLGALAGLEAAPLPRELVARAIERHSPRSARAASSRAFELGSRAVHDPRSPRRAASENVEPPRQGGGRMQWKTASRPAAKN